MIAVAKRLLTGLETTVASATKKDEKTPQFADTFRQVSAGHADEAARVLPQRALRQDRNVSAGKKVSHPPTGVDQGGIVGKVKVGSFDGTAAKEGGGIKLDAQPGRGEYTALGNSGQVPLVGTASLPDETAEGSAASTLRASLQQSVDGSDVSDEISHGVVAETLPGALVDHVSPKIQSETTKSLAVVQGQSAKKHNVLLNTNEIEGSAAGTPSKEDDLKFQEVDTVTNSDVIASFAVSAQTSSLNAAAPAKTDSSTSPQVRGGFAQVASDSSGLFADAGRPLSDGASSRTRRQVVEGAGRLAGGSKPGSAKAAEQDDVETGSPANATGTATAATHAPNAFGSAVIAVAPANTRAIGSSDTVGLEGQAAIAGGPQVQLSRTAATFQNGRSSAALGSGAEPGSLLEASGGGSVEAAGQVVEASLTSGASIGEEGAGTSSKSVLVVPGAQSGEVAVATAGGTLNRGAVIEAAESLVKSGQQHSVQGGDTPVGKTRKPTSGEAAASSGIPAANSIATSHGNAGGGVTAPAAANMRSGLGEHPGLADAVGSGAAPLTESVAMQPQAGVVIVPSVLATAHDKAEPTMPANAGPVLSGATQGSDQTLMPVPHTTLTATPTVLEVGVPGGTQGWLKIRAEIGEGGVVQASVSFATHAGQEALHRELPAISAFLESEHVPVNLQVTHPLSSIGLADVTGAIREGGFDGGSTMGQSLNQSGLLSGSGGGETNAGMLSGGGGEGANGRQSEGDDGRSDVQGRLASTRNDVADANWSASASYDSGAAGNGGGWLNVIA